MSIEVSNKAIAGALAAKTLELLSTDIKNTILADMAAALIKAKDEILHANASDVTNGKNKGLSPALLDRLKLDEKRLKQMADGLIIVKDLPDPVGEELSRTTRPNGLLIRKVRVPFGLIGIIYESRPNVTADAAGLCLKSGNAVLLKGGSDAINSNKAIVKVLQEVLAVHKVPKEAVQLIETTDHKAVTDMLRLKQYIDLIIPRGGAGLIKEVVENSLIPVIETGIGNCHVYIHSEADPQKAVEITFNAKVQRPSVCNAAEKLLIDETHAYKVLPLILAKLKTAGVELRGDKASRLIDNDIKEATQDDWYTEYLALIMGVKVVKDHHEAILHINKYGSKHSEAIVTENEKVAKEFMERVDAASVLWNASTRFTDGGEFGFGAEIGISTQKLHARGPMGLPELTTYKYLVKGTGQIRQ